MALQNKYKDQMDDFKRQPHIKTSITNEDTKKQIEKYLKDNVDTEIKVRIVKRDKTKTFDSYYEIDISPVFKHTEDNGVLFKQIVADIKEYLSTIHISKHAYELFVKNIGNLK